MRRFLLIFCAVGASALYARAQPGIEVPTAGAIVDSSGALREVQGVAGSFLLGPPSMSGVLSAACSEKLCLAKTDSRIISTTGETDAPPGPAIFGFSGDNAIVFFSEAREFARWHNDTLELLDWVVEGEVLSVRFSAGEAEIAVRRDGQVWIVLPDGSVIDSIADSTGPVLLLPDGLLLATADEVILRRRDGSEVRFELAGTHSISAMGAHYAAIHVPNNVGNNVGNDAIYALRTEPGRESLFLLPGNAP